MARTPIRTRSKPEAGYLAAGPFRGCRDATDPTTADPGLCRYLGNMYRASGPEGVAQLGRPGFATMGAAAGTLLQAGPMTWTQINGTRQTVKVLDGEIYDADASYVWTKRVSTANLTTNSVTLSATARVALIPFADGLVVSDGVNLPFSWTGAAGAGGITKLTNAAIFYGPPTVKDSCLIGIKASDRQTIVWSEPGEVNVGYEATIGSLIYANAWDNPGGYPDPMTSVAGTNEALYVLRARASLAILGAMGPDLSTAGTKANVSPDVGTVSPWAVLVLTQGVFIVDADANPWLLHYGAPGPLPLWKDCLETVKYTPRASLPNALALYDEATASVLLGLPGLSKTYPSHWLCFHADDLQFNGPWYWGREASSAGTVIDANGVQRWAHGDLAGGYTLIHGTPLDGPWNDVVAGVTTAITHRAVGPYLGFDPAREMHVNALQFGFTNGATQASLSYETSRGQTAARAVTFSTGAAGFRLNVDFVDVGVVSHASASAQVRYGTAGRGRWLSPIATHAVLGESIGFDVMAAEVAYTQGNARQP